MVGVVKLIRVSNSPPAFSRRGGRPRAAVALAEEQGRGGYLPQTIVRQLLPSFFFQGGVAEGRGGFLPSFFKEGQGRFELRSRS